MTEYQIFDKHVNDVSHLIATTDMYVAAIDVHGQLVVFTANSEDELRKRVTRHYPSAKETDFGFDHALLNAFSKASRKAAAYDSLVSLSRDGVQTEFTEFGFNSVIS